MSAFVGVGRSRLERLRIADAAHDQMITKMLWVEQGWDTLGQDRKAMRAAVIEVSVAMFEFAKSAGITEFGSQFCSHLLVAIGELQNGRHSDLLRPSKVPSNQLAASDRVQQGVAYACVETLREAGLNATESRREVSRMMASEGFKKFSTHTLSAIQTRLTGPGSTEDQSYELYSFARQQFQTALAGKKVGGCYHPDEARNAVKVILRMLRDRDHRLDFFSDPRAE